MEGQLLGLIVPVIVLGVAALIAFDYWLRTANFSEDDEKDDESDSDDTDDTHGTGGNGKPDSGAPHGSDTDSRRRRPSHSHSPSRSTEQQPADEGSKRTAKKGICCRGHTLVRAVQEGLELTRINKVAQNASYPDAHEMGKVAKQAQDEYAALAETCHRSIYVRNLAQQVTEQDLRNLFGRCGQINIIEFQQDTANKWYIGSDTARIEFADKTSLREAVDLSGIVLHDKEIEVMKVRVESPKYYRRRRLEHEFHIPTMPYSFTSETPKIRIQKRLVIADISSPGSEAVELREQSGDAGSLESETPERRGQQQVNTTQDAGNETPEHGVQLTEDSGVCGSGSETTPKRRENSNAACSPRSKTPEQDEELQEDTTQSSGIETPEQEGELLVNSAGVRDPRNDTSEQEVKPQVDSAGACGPRNEARERGVKPQVGINGACYPRNEIPEHGTERQEGTADACDPGNKAAEREVGLQEGTTDGCDSDNQTLENGVEVQENTTGGGDSENEVAEESQESTADVCDPGNETLENGVELQEDNGDAFGSLSKTPKQGTEEQQQSGISNPPERETPARGIELQKSTNSLEWDIV